MMVPASGYGEQAGGGPERRGSAAARRLPGTTRLVRERGPEGQETAELLKQSKFQTRKSPNFELKLQKV
jgi:hypothetical protein